MQIEAFCSTIGKHPSPPVCGGNGLRANTPGISPSCSGGFVSDATVAINFVAFSKILGCGDTICMPRPGAIRKTVTDKCRACDLGSIDDYSSSGKCGLLDFGTTITLKIQP